MFSLYRGELHNVSGVPRQWTIPKSQISASVFKKALVKRNAALSKLFQSSASGQKTDPNAAPPLPAANGTGGHHASESDDDSGGFEEREERDGADNSADGDADSMAENAVGSSEPNVAATKEETKAVEEGGERRRERKRRREQDLRDDMGRCVHKREDHATIDFRELTTSEVEQPASLHKAEPMIVDVVDQLEAMDCDATVSEKAVIDTDETNAEKVRVRVPEAGEMSEAGIKQASNELGAGDARELKQKDVENQRRNGEVSHLADADADFEKLQAGASQIGPATAVQNGGIEAADVKMKDVDPNRRAELEAKLEKLTAEKHRFVLRLKRILNEEEMKKRESLTSASPKAQQGAVAGHSDTAGVAPQVEGHGGGARASADLEDGELEYARTPSPPSSNVHGGAGDSHNSLGPSPVAPGTGRQTFVPQHSSQSSKARGGYFAPNVGISPSTSASTGAGGALSPGAGYTGSLPSPSGTRPYPHNLAMQQHAAAYGQKVSSGVHGHGQFNAMQSSGAPVGISPPGVAGGPPGFSGYPITSSVHSHHSHLPQQASSSPHIAAGQQVVSSSPLLTTPRGPPSYHDVRLGGGAWIQR